MKKAYFIVLFFLVIGLFAQNQTNNEIVQTIENGIITYETVFNTPGINKRARGNQTSSVNAGLYLPTESFEDTFFPPTGWELFSIDFLWEQETFNSNTGSNSSVLYGEPFIESWLITPVIDLDAATGPFLNYYEYVEIDLGLEGEHNIVISTDYDGTDDPDFFTWDTLRTGITNLDSWDLRTIDLSSYIGQSVYIAFQYIGIQEDTEFGTNWYIDDVSVTDDGSGGCSGSEPEPDCAVIKSPPNGATLLQTDLGISWGPPGFEDITKQLLYVGTDGGGVTTPTNLKNGDEHSENTTGITLNNLSPNTKYYWQIIPVNCETEAQNCPIWSFTTGDGTVNSGGGGPTQGNYSYENSIAGTSTQPVYNWIDISGTGTDLISTIADEETKGPYNIGFPFSFLGNTYSQFYINSNGFVTFVNTVGQTNFPHNIPGTRTPDNLIAGYWMNLNPTNTNVTGKHLYYGISGGEMVITYEKYPQFIRPSGSYEPADANGWITFQIILKPSGDVKVQFKEKGSSFVDADYYTGTVGIENNDGTTGITYRRKDTGGPIFNGTSPLALEFTPNHVSAEVKIFLEGPYNSPNMNAGLGSSIPLTQPYTSSPWSYSGNEETTLSFITNNNIVDWVLVELRTEATAATATTVVSRRAALVRNDGVILDTDGSVDIDFYGASGGNYYIAVYHRNHLSVLSSQAVNLN